MRDENSSLAVGTDGIERHFPAAVADTSFFAAFLLGGDDEFGYGAAKAEFASIIGQGGMIFVPALFWYEIGNVLLNASRPKKNGGAARISVSDANDILYDLKRLPVVTRYENDLEILMRIQDLARQNSLSFYDASFLELARRLNLRLLTFDEKLIAAVSGSNLPE